MSQRHIILLVSNKWDISVDFIVRQLRERELHFLRLNTEDLPYSKCSVTFPDVSFMLPYGRETMDMTNHLKSVLFRRPGRPFEGHENPPSLDRAVVDYCTDQWHSFIEGLLSINDVVWINNPRTNDLMECKIVQLRKAVELGFHIPRTCITSSKERAQKFIQSCKGLVIAKGLYSSLIEYPERDYFIFTTPVSSLENVQSAEIGITPIIFQEQMTDKIDYRVTVVGDKIYAVRIESASASPIPVDWRLQKDGLTFIPTELPEDVRDKCLSFVSRCGLIFGAIDLVKVKDEFYFLEINPNGEWGWLQMNAGLPIAEAIVDCLVAGDKGY